MKTDREGESAKFKKHLKTVNAEECKQFLGALLWSLNEDLEFTRSLCSSSQDVVLDSIVTLDKALPDERHKKLMQQIATYYFTGNARSSLFLVSAILKISKALKIEEIYPTTIKALEKEFKGVCRQIEQTNESIASEKNLKEH